MNDDVEDPEFSDEFVAGLPARIDELIAAEEFWGACYFSKTLGEVNERRGDRAGAEAAYRQAVELARRLGPDDTVPMVEVFGLLMSLLSPSEESIALGAELLTYFPESDDFLQRVKSAQAAGRWAIAKLAFAAVRPELVDEAVGNARQAIDTLFTLAVLADGEGVQRQVTATLRALGRDADADRFEEEAREARARRHPPPESLEVKAERLREEVDDATQAGDLADGCQSSFLLGDTLNKLGDREGAETAYRTSVVFARQLDGEHAELMLAAFRSAIYFLAPSEESVALATELVDNMIERSEMFHPMRAAEAIYDWATAKLMLAEIRPDHVDDAAAAAESAQEMLDQVCHHGEVQALQRRVAAVLRASGRDDESSRWQAEADQYADWSITTSQEIPGHVHLRDIR